MREHAFVLALAATRHSSRPIDFRLRPQFSQQLNTAVQEAVGRPASASGLAILSPKRINFGNASGKSQIPFSYSDLEATASLASQLHGAEALASDSLRGHH